jgi:hypothetical protein
MELSCKRKSKITKTIATGLQVRTTAEVAEMELQYKLNSGQRKNISCLLRQNCEA